MDKVICVAKVINDSKLVLNVGKEDGVEYGDDFLIYSISKEDIIDPITNKSLGKLELVKGKGFVTSVQEKMCIIESSNKKEKTSRIVRDSSNSSFPVSTWGQFTRPTKVEEQIEEVTLPFVNPAVGDFAKEI